MFRCRRTLGTIVLGWLLATQAVLAVTPCLSPDATAAGAFTQMPDCHEAPPANLCLGHCIESDRTTTPAQIAIPTTPDLAVLVVPEPRLAAAPITRYWAAACGNSCGPPIPIRFQSFLL